eukprot:763670-Hanusia_phi.AAC.6
MMDSHTPSPGRGDDALVLLTVGQRTHVGVVWLQELHESPIEHVVHAYASPLVSCDHPPLAVPQAHGCDPRRCHVAERLGQEAGGGVPYPDVAARCRDDGMVDHGVERGNDRLVVRELRARGMIVIENEEPVEAKSLRATGRDEYPIYP